MPNAIHLVRCPFYIHDKNRNVTCEDTARTFKDPAEKDAWMDCYCDERWNECPYAMDLDSMYQRIEEGADMAEEKVKQIKEATKKEHKKLAMMYDAADKRAERRQKKIDELRAVNQTLTQNNIHLGELNKKYLKRWREERAQLEDYQKHEAERYFQMARLYEDRIAYLIDTYCDGRLAEADVKAWAEGKEYALTFDKESEEPIWIVKTREETEADHEDVSESVQGAAETAGPKAEE